MQIAQYNDGRITTEVDYLQKIVKTLTDLIPEMEKGKCMRIALRIALSDIETIPQDCLLEE